MSKTFPHYCLIFNLGKGGREGKICIKSSDIFKKKILPLNKLVIRIFEENMQTILDNFDSFTSVDVNLEFLCNETIIF